MKRYRKATSYSRSVQLLGYTVGSVLGQLLVSFDLMSYNNILVFTLVLTAIALLTSFFLPVPQKSMFFHRRRGRQTAAEQSNTINASLEDGGGEMESGEGEPDAEKLEESIVTQSCGQVLLQLWRDFRHCYSSRQLLYWSVWWAMATCGYNQTVNYVQVSYEGSINKNVSCKSI